MQEQEGSMLSSLALAGITWFVLGTVIVVTLAVRAGAGRASGSIARLLYDTERENTR